MGSGRDARDLSAADVRLVSADKDWYMCHRIEKSREK